MVVEVRVVGLEEVCLFLWLLEPTHKDHAGREARHRGWLGIGGTASR